MLAAYINGCVPPNSERYLLDNLCLRGAWQLTYCYKLAKRELEIAP